MRWNEILMESVKKYMPMFVGMLNLDPSIDKVATQRDYAKLIQHVEDELVREDRVVWALRWHRFDMLDGWMRAGSKTDNPLMKAEVRPKAEKLMAKYLSELGMTHDMAEKAFDLYFEGSKNKWKHFARHPAHPLQQHVWGRQKPHELNNELVDIEVAWNKKQNQIIKYSGDPEDRQRDFSVFLDLTSIGWLDWAWYDLETTSCDREAKAMGHCGNGGGDWGDTILSLRRKVGPGAYRPSLSFILDSDHMLGEMKGRENNKPDPKYHPAIVALLKDERIKGLKGGGYEPLNNFEMKDLDEKTKKEIQAQNPLMRDIPELYDYFIEHKDEWEKTQVELYNLVADRLRAGIKDDVEARYEQESPKVDLEKGIMTINEYRDLDAYLENNNSYIYLLQQCFDEHLPKAIHRDKRMGWLRAQNIAQAAKSDLFIEMAREMLATDMPYKANDSGGDEMTSEMLPDGSIRTTLTISQWFHLFWGEDSVQNRQYMEHIDDCETRWDGESLDYLIDDERSQIPSVHVKNELIEYLKDQAAAADSRNGYEAIKWPAPEPDLVDAVVKAYGHLSGQSYTEPNPRGNQSEFDFEKGGRKPADNGWNWN